MGEGQSKLFCNNKSKAYLLPISLEGKQTGRTKLEFSLRVNPNPATDLNFSNLLLRVTNEKSCRLAVKIIDVSGKVVESNLWNLRKIVKSKCGKNLFERDLFPSQGFKRN
jgi:hypothetical protein